MKNELGIYARNLTMWEITRDLSGNYVIIIYSNFGNRMLYFLMNLTLVICTFEILNKNHENLNVLVKSFHYFRESGLFFLGNKSRLTSQEFILSYTVTLRYFNKSFSEEINIFLHHSEKTEI